MQSLDWSESVILAEWAEIECRHIDLIASWETLMSVYDALGFIGPDTDDAKLAEFKQIITEMNKFLTRMKNGLSNASTAETAVEYLLSNLYSTEMVKIKNRPGIAYNKLKQQWVMHSIDVLRNMAVAEVEEGERDAY